LIFGIWRNRRQEQDDELLSAYIDRRLGGDAEVELPVHLHADAAGLAETAAILRSVERVRAPRSFALTPEMVQLPDSSSFSSITGHTGWSLALFRGSGDRRSRRRRLCAGVTGDWQYRRDS